MKATPWILVLALATTGLASPALAQDAIVPDDFRFVRRAVTLATDTDGDGTIEIFVRAGTYVENVLVRRPNVSLSGEGAATTTIRGTGTLDTVRIRAAGALVEGFTIEASGLLDSIDIRRATGSVVQNNILTGGDSGVRLRGNSVQVLDNEIFGTTNEAIKASFGRALIVMGNFVHDNADDGIDFLRLSQSRAQGNIVMNNGGNGLRDRGGVQNRFIGNQSMNNTNNGLALRNSQGMLIDSNTASGNLTNGLRMVNTSDSLVTQNAFTGNTEWGVRRRDWTNDDFDAALGGVQDPPGDNDLSGNGNGDLRDD